MRVALLVSAAFIMALLLGSATPSPAQDAGTLERRVDRAQTREATLEESLARLSTLDGRLARQVAALERRRAMVQSDLDLDEAELATVQAGLRRERARALRLRRRLARARRMLAERLLTRYKASDVDAISVVLNAASFAALMERAAFLRRIQDNDEEILVAVRTARADALRERRRLDAAEARQRRVVAGLRARRGAVAAMAAGAASRRAALVRVRAARAEALVAARADRRRAQRDLGAARRAAARAAARASAAAVAPRPGRGDPAGGGWAIPWPIVQCESGGQNLPPNSAGASGYYQIMPETWKGLGGKGPHAYLRPKTEQDAAAAKLWAGGAGRSNWVCADMVS